MRVMLMVGAYAPCKSAMPAYHMPKASPARLCIPSERHVSIPPHAFNNPSQSAPSSKNP